jgi:phosphoglycolate phosphatase-like HAD superfamily hydrolase
MIRTILFDFDGVLADTLGDMLRFSEEACAQLGRPRRPTPEDLNAVDSMDIQSYGRQLGLPEDLLDDFGAFMVRRFEEKKEPPGLFDGLGEVILRLSHSCRLGVVTGNSEAAVRAFLAHHGLGSVMGCVIGADTPGTRAEKIDCAAERLDGQLSSTCMVGDSVSDVRAAREAGVMSIAVAWGHQSERRLRAAGPDAVVRSPAELLAVVSGEG